METLETAIALRPEHLSIYELMVEEGTPFAVLDAKGMLELPHEEEVENMFLAAQELLTTAGYARYEFSNYSLAGRECRHNINYWLNGSYLGLGASAVSCLAGLRIKNVIDPHLYSSLVQSQRPPYLEAECLPRGARFRETVIMGLRMQAGIPIAFLMQRFGVSPLDYYGDTLQSLIDKKFVIVDEGHLRLTAKGFPIANQILSRLV
jgi:oxygen-independent coproporphyrinogen-3 oxidase